LKLKEVAYLVGLKPTVKTYSYELRHFDLPTDGRITCAKWLHPKDYRPQISQEVVDELRKFVSPGDVAIDIGAHTGDTSIPIALATGKTGCVLAFEPNPYVFAILQQNASLNPEKTHIIPLMFAASPVDAQLEFHYSDSGFCNGGRFEGISKWLHAHAFELQVQGRNVQALLKQLYPELIPRIRFIKIDTEGYEPVVLESLRELITQVKPYMMVEVYTHLNREQRRALHRSITSLGYTIRRIIDNSHYWGEVLGENDLGKWRSFDIFCVPNPTAS
jgi:FkbM family methyltransferase